MWDAGGTACVRWRPIPGKSRSIEKTTQYQVNAHNSAHLVHDIVEKLTADGSFVVRSSLLFARGPLRRVRTARGIGWIRRIIRGVSCVS
jgi:hypothetical protein